ncbi:MAG: DNA repair protein RadA [Candidatus Dojkabacteria bacterium]|nr:MAG: DNA repair protein RadA [Candidatus Dojkabacteria bacterium]
MKNNNRYICTSCAAIYPAWQGKCTQCGAWNTIILEEINEGISQTQKCIEDLQTFKIQSTRTYAESRIKFSLNSFNNILGGGILHSQVILFAGEPGIGKSTLLAQLCSNIQTKTLYISGEENFDQIAQRALRLGTPDSFENIEFSNDTDLASILTYIESKKYEIVIIDSIQTVTNNNSFNNRITNQIREYASLITDAAKNSHTSVLMVGQITKDGSIAGPKVLEHIVDTVLYFEGNYKDDTRILRVKKNRFGKTSEIAVFRMSNNGLQEVNNLEWFFIDNLKCEEGLAYSIYNEGSVYFIIEVQALCIKTSFTYPKRISNGYDAKRLEMLIAILSKKLGLPLENCDIYVNIVGGIKITDTSADLAVAAAIISSFQNKPLADKPCFIGEISLTGEVRKIHKQTEKIKKAKEYGFKKIYYDKVMPNIKLLLEHNTL